MPKYHKYLVDRIEALLNVEDAAEKWLNFLREKYGNEDWKCPYVKAIADAVEEYNMF